MRPTVVQFGAGNIGRGFVGHLFAAAGYEVVFVDVAAELVAALNARRSYPLRLVGPDRFETVTVAPVRAVPAGDAEAVAQEVAACALACTAVGAPALPGVAPLLAAGIRRRQEPLDVLLFENRLHVSRLMRELLRPHLTEAEQRRVGLVETVVGRMVPGLPEEERAEDPLLVVAEDYAVLQADRAAFVGPIPPVPGLLPVDDFAAWTERKLFLHNLGHAVAAYSGHLRGHRFVHEAMADPAVRDHVLEAMHEAGEALARKHRLDREALRQEIEQLARRFANPALRDPIARVGRDPARKLQPDDRLVGAALTCLDWGVEPIHIARGIAAALRFDAPDDASARAVQQTLREQGLGQALLELTGQRPDGELGRHVLEAWDALEKLPA